MICAKALLVDAHTLFREGLEKILTASGDIKIAGSVGTGAEAIQHMDHAPQPDVVLLEISLPDRNGVDVLKQMRRNYPQLPILVLTMHSEDEFGIRALKAGATGYITKHSTAEQLLTAIRQVTGGRRYISPKLAENLAGQLLRGNHHEIQHHALSDREFHVMRQIAQGKKPAEIAAALCLSPKTVSVYRARVLNKLGLRGNAEIVHYAIDHQLLV